MATSIATATVRRVVRAMDRLAPLALAETSWDNVGLLLDVADLPALPGPSASSAAETVFLTNDLTEPVLAEALALQPAVRVIVAYHPPIFSAWKRITRQDPKQSIVLKCAARGIAIYSPHTSLDNCVGGINDWLLTSLNLKGAITPITPTLLAAFPGAGAGRVIELEETVTFDVVVARIKASLGLSHVRIAKAANTNLIRRIAACAGSGASVLKSVAADVLYTGEMSHHDVLAAVARGVNVVLCEHSNTERGYLKQVLQPRLEELLNSTELKDESESHINLDLNVVVSETDADPLTVV